MVKSVDSSCRSRIGRQPIQLPAGVTCEIKDNLVKLVGQKGQVALNYPRALEVKIEQGQLLVVPQRRDASAIWGTIASRLKALVKGVSEGCSRIVKITGVGYRATLVDNVIELSLGKSHRDKITNIPEGVKIDISKDSTSLTISGCDPAIVGNTAAKFRKLRKMNPYNAAGISLDGDIIRRKEGKKKK